MTVKQCDRCGAIFPYYEYLENEGGCRIRMTCNYEGGISGVFDYDLCENCQKAFNDFMRADKENDNDEL